MYSNSFIIAEKDYFSSLRKTICHPESANFMVSRGKYTPIVSLQTNTLDLNTLLNLAAAAFDNTPVIRDQKPEDVVSSVEFISTHDYYPTIGKKGAFSVVVCSGNTRETTILEHVIPQFLIGLHNKKLSLTVIPKFHSGNSSQIPEDMPALVIGYCATATHGISEVILNKLRVILMSENKDGQLQVGLADMNDIDDVGVAPTFFSLNATMHWLEGGHEEKELRTLFIGIRHGLVMSFPE